MSALSLSGLAALAALAARPALLLVGVWLSRSDGFRGLGGLALALVVGRAMRIADEVLPAVGVLAVTAFGGSPHPWLAPALVLTADLALARWQPDAVGSSVSAWLARGMVAGGVTWAVAAHDPWAAAGTAVLVLAFAGLDRVLHRSSSCTDSSPSCADTRSCPTDSPPAPEERGGES